MNPAEVIIAAMASYSSAHRALIAHILIGPYLWNDLQQWFQRDCERRGITPAAAGTMLTIMGVKIKRDVTLDTRSWAIVMDGSADHARSLIMRERELRLRAHAIGSRS